jgi:chromate transporter
MKAGTGTLLTLAGHFALMSLFAIGGANSAVPEMHRLAVEVERWMTEQQFTDMFAIAQVTPSERHHRHLIGYHVAGLVAPVTTAAVRSHLRAGILRRRCRERFKDAPWRAAIKADWSGSRSARPPALVVASVAAHILRQYPWCWSRRSCRMRRA